LNQLGRLAVYLLDSEMFILEAKLRVGNDLFVIDDFG